MNLSNKTPDELCNMWAEGNIEGVQACVELIRRNKELEAEILRLRTTETASAHALDRLRQFFCLDLIPSEPPSNTAHRIEEVHRWSVRLWGCK